jgi:hypothetical protein
MVTTVIITALIIIIIIIILIRGWGQGPKISEEISMF